MKSNKRLLSVFLSLAVMLTMCMTTAAAIDADDGSVATITVEAVQQAVHENDVVTLDVSIANNPGFVAYNFTIQYDKAALALQSINDGDFRGALVGNPDTGKVNFTADVQQECTGDGVLFTLSFQAKADCADGTQVTLAVTTFKNAGNGSILSMILPGGTTGGSTTGGSTTGGSTTGGSMTGGSTTGGSTTDGSTTGGSTTGGSTTGGSTTGGSTTGGSTTGGSTTGGSTTGGSTTGGSTTGGSTTGGSTTGGSTTGGSTTGGSTTGGSTTGGSTTGGSTTGGSTTGGSTTGGSTTGGSTTGAVKVTDIAVGVENYSVVGQTVTIASQNACRLGYLEGGKYVAVVPKDNGDGSYSFEVPAGVEEVLLAIKGDANGDGKADATDLARLNRMILRNEENSASEMLLCDVNGDGKIDAVDLALMNRQYLQNTHLDWDT